MIPWYKRSNSRFFRKNKTTIVKSGSEYFNLLLSLINNTSSTIHLQVYILDNDNTGRQVLDALIAAAKRGVQVYLLVDGYASSPYQQPLLPSLMKPGSVFVFLPLSSAAKISISAEGCTKKYLLQMAGIAWLAE